MDDVSLLIAAWRRMARTGTEEELIHVLPSVICGCGFTRATVTVLTGSLGRAVSAHVDGEEDGAARLLAAVNATQVNLAGLPAETDMLRRLEPILVHIVDPSERALSKVAQAVGTDCYVAAPVVVGTRPALMFHADRPADPDGVDSLDAERLGLVALLAGRLLEQSASRRRIAVLRGEVRRANASTRVILDEQLDAPLDLAPTVQVGYGLVDGHAMTDWFVSPRDTPALTAREREVMDLVGAGLSNPQIAERLVISEQTVRSHFKRILRKLRASNRAEAVARWISLSSTQSMPSGPSSDPSRN